MNATVFVLNGPNLDLLGRREPAFYGSETLDAIAERMNAHAQGLGLALDIRQSNHEGHLIDWLHEAGEVASAVLINAGGYSHTSVSIRDAVAALAIPVIEVHLSNIQAREQFRHRSLVAEVANGSITGFGALGYLLALDAAAHLCKGASAPDRPAGQDSTGQYSTGE